MLTAPPLPRASTAHRTLVPACSTCLSAFDDILLLSPCNVCSYSDEGSRLLTAGLAFGAHGVSVERMGPVVIKKIIILNLRLSALAHHHHLILYCLSLVWALELGCPSSCD